MCCRWPDEDEVSGASASAAIDPKDRLPADDRWRWMSSESWRSFTAHRVRRDFEREVHRERWAEVQR
jgi:hypothetical protein